MDGVQIAPNYAALEAQIDADTRQKLQKSSKEYEGVFMSQMVNIMMQDVDFNPMGGGKSAAMDTYKGLLANELGTSISKNGPGIGLAEPIYGALLQAQINSQRGNTP